LLAAVLSAAPPQRTWTDRTGQHSVEASLQRVTDGHVVLERVDGRVVEVPVTRLSDGDIAFLGSFLEARSWPKQRGTNPASDTKGKLPAQDAADRDAGRDGSAVQLPTFSYNTVNTTVSVPDGGTALLGGIKRFSEGRVERGVPGLSKLPGANRLFGSRGIGSSRSSSMMTVTPRIIILEEEEYRQTGVVSDALLARRPDLAADGQAGLARGRAPGNTAREPRPELTDEELRRRTQWAQQKRYDEAIIYFARAQDALTRGKGSVAKVYYEMAARRTSGDFQRHLLAQIAALSTGPSSRR
jgi:hypothetical protein